MQAFPFQELLSRAHALLRRAYHTHEYTPVRVGRLSINTRTREVTVGDRRVELSAKEFALLRTLARDPTRVFPPRPTVQQRSAPESARVARNEATANRSGSPATAAMNASERKHVSRTAPSPS